MSVVKRSEIFYLRKRVPNRYSLVERRDTIWVSLHTDSETVAHHKASSAWQHYIEAWEARLAGDNEDVEIRFDVVKKLAAVRGFRYVDANNIAT